MVSRGGDVDVVVVGGGNAGYSAAHAAAQRGRRVVLLEKAPAESPGGNSFYTAGAFRIAHEGLPGVGELLDADERLGATVLAPYPEEDFTADMVKVTGGRTDPDLCAALVGGSRDALRWLHELGLRFRLMYERQSYPDSAGRHVFWGGLAIGATGGGRGLVEQHVSVARRLGVQVRHDAAVDDLTVTGGRVTGVCWRDPDGGRHEVAAESVVLAAGGFEANPELRRRHLGDGWEHAKVRGTPLNTGDMLSAALRHGAVPAGDWTTCHSTAWDANADNFGNRELTNQLTRQSYPLGIVVNVDGRRFLDEGADFRNYTYARYGAEILRQPGGVAFQLFDATTRPMLRAEEYESPNVSVVVADTLAELARRTGIDPAGLLSTVEQFNAAINDASFDPTILDGRRSAVTPPKSNWALALQRPPFYAYPVTCGITFTFGGLRADQQGRVLDSAGSALPGLFVCGEMLGGLFSGNYPGGSGLTAGTVFGRLAGAIA